MLEAYFLKNFDDRYNLLKKYFEDFVFLLYQQADFLDTSTWKFNNDNTDTGIQTFDVVHDKGTFDAVCLNPDNADEKRRQYIVNLKVLLPHPGSWFLITSCNWTADEIKKHFHEGMSAL